MENNQIIILIVFGAIFTFCWVFSMLFTLNYVEPSKNAGSFVITNLIIAVSFIVSITIIVATTTEINKLKKESLKKHVKPEYEQVTETFYRKIERR